MTNITLPHLWNPRHYQKPVLQYLFTPDGKIKEGARAACVWHRRSGKDSLSLQIQAIASQLRVGTYWTMLPTLQQARRVIWDGIDRYGRRMIDQAFPKALEAGINNTDMKKELKNGSVWQCVGSDNYDSLVGSNPVGVVFSEYSIADPMAWDFIRPILTENGGFAIFIYTPRGKNHGEKLFKIASASDEWFSSLLTIDDTYLDDGTTNVISRTAYEKEIADGMDPMLARQEYYCSFDAGLFGAYYTDQLKLAEMGDFPWDPAKPVCTAWDLGIRDSTAIWFFQQPSPGGAIHVIDYWEGNNTPLVEWYRRLHETPYNFNTHVGPHDLDSRDKDYGRKSIDIAGEHGVFFEIAPRVSVSTGIEAVRNFLPRLRFNMATAERGYDCLANYKKEYNNKLQVWLDKPTHDWSSHGADAMRYAALHYADGLPTMYQWKPLDYSNLNRIII
jgi:hypothetical protein